MNSTSNKQTIYIRKLNGLGQKITVQNNLSVKKLKQMVRSLSSLQSVNFNLKDFNLIYKGKNITSQQQSTLKDLHIPNDGIIHLVFVQQEQINHNLNSQDISKSQINQKKVLSSLGLNQLDHNISININKPQQISLRLIFNGIQQEFLVSPSLSIIDFKKKIAIRLNLIYQSLILSHLGVQMMDSKLLKDYSVTNDTLVSLKFNLQKPEKKKLQTRMVSSVTFSDQNNQPNSNNLNNDFQNNKFTVNSSKSIESQKDESTPNSKRISSLMGNNKTTMYKSDINSFGNSHGASKAALMFKNALHQKIIETQSVVSGSFSQDTSLTGCDPNSIMITVKNEEQTKQFLFQCAKTHQMLNIKQKLLEIQNLKEDAKLQISLEEDLFQSIDLNKSGCVTLGQIVKKMGKERAVFIYRII